MKNENDQWKISTYFYNNKIPKEGLQFVCLSVILTYFIFRMEKNEKKKKEKKKRLSILLTTLQFLLILLINSSDKECFDEENSDEENSKNTHIVKFVS